MVRQIGLGIKGQEEVDLLLGLELGGHLCSCDHLLLLRARIDESRHLQIKIIIIDI